MVLPLEVVTGIETVFVMSFFIFFVGASSFCFGGSVLGFEAGNVVGVLVVLIFLNKEIDGFVFDPKRTFIYRNISGVEHVTQASIDEVNPH